MITDGRLARGARIPGERELAVSMSASRTTVRAALRDLELRGLIDRRRRRGTFVVDDVDRRLADGTLLGRLDRDERDLLEVMDLRATIEPPIAARAAGRATAGDVLQLVEILAAARAATKVEEVVALDEAFHRGISRASHNALLDRLLETTTAWMGPSRSLALQSARRVAASLAAHEAIVEAIRAHDPEAAATAMRRHIEAVNAEFARAAGIPEHMGPRHDRSQPARAPG